MLPLMDRKLHTAHNNVMAQAVVSSDVLGRAGHAAISSGQRSAIGTLSQRWRSVMVELVVQMAVVGIWAVMFALQVRRLLRLSSVDLVSRWGAPLRQCMGRVWWWLGREEFWSGVQSDVARCLQMTVMVFLTAWGALV
jgi:hypothetical protein